MVVILAGLGGWLLARKRWANSGNGANGTQGNGNGNATSYGDHNDHDYARSYGNATSVIAPSSYQPPGEQKLGFGDPQVYQDPYHDEAYQAHHHVPPPSGGWSPEAPSGPYELGLQEARQRPRGHAMEMSVDLPLELPAGHR